MRKVTFGGAVSLDNYLARPDDSVDWLMWSDEVTELMNEYWPKVDTIVMGRKTYEVALKNSPASGGANPYGDIKTFVFSRTLEPGIKNGVEIIADDPGEFVNGLKRQEGKEICIMGGGDLARSLFDAGAIDEIGFNIHPVLLGRGVPLFYEMPQQIALELIECRQFKNGCVVLSYRVRY